MRDIQQIKSKRVRREEERRVDVREMCGGVRENLKQSNFKIDESQHREGEVVNPNRKRAP